MPLHPDTVEYESALRVHAGRIADKCPLDFGSSEVAGVHEATREHMVTRIIGIIDPQYRTMLENAKEDPELWAQLEGDETRREEIDDGFVGEILDPVAKILFWGSDDEIIWSGARLIYDCDIDLIIAAVITNALEGLWLGTTD